MKKYILEYMNKVQSFMDSDMKDADIEKIREVLSEFEIKISYFQHERLIHWLVTMLVAILTFICVGVYVISGEIYVLALIGILLVLLVPYIMHYYLLENETQKMYGQYDSILKIIKDKKEGWASIDE